MNIDTFHPAEIARSIIDSTTFLSLATFNGKETWIAPFFLYMISSKPFTL